MKTLIYLSSEWIYDTDIQLLQYLTKEYKVHYFFYSDPTSPRVTKKEVIDYADKCGAVLHLKESTTKQLSPKNILSFCKLQKEIRALSPDIILRQEPNLYYSIAEKLFKGPRTIYFIHDVEIHTGTHNRKLRQLFSDLTIKFNKNFILFSDSQKELFKKRYGTRKNVLSTHMSVKDFGNPTIKMPSISNGIKLLFFGRIEYNKGLDLLIDALESIFKTTNCNISLTICGKGCHWEECKKHIKTPERYNLNIEYIPNENIANIFTSHHFLVLPYRDTTQSGPLMIAANYGVPLFAANHNSFREIYDDSCGLYYDNIIDGLKELQNLTESSYSEYLKCCEQLKDKFSGENITQQIVKYIKNIK